MGYIYLLLAILIEIVATSLIKASEGFTKIFYGLTGVGLFALCLYLLSLSLKDIQLSIAYAIWCGLGIVLTTLVSVLFWKDKLTFAMMVGIVFVLVGVVILSLSTKS